MAGFRSVKKYTDAWAEGRSFTSHFGKRPSSTTEGWQDLSMHGGGPPANYYASEPLVAATLNGNRGFYIGDDKAPAARYLTSFSFACTNLNYCAPLVLCDYLLYYPFIDCDDTTTQLFDNTVTIPRYTDGEGVMVVPVQLTSSTPTGGSFTFEYVNQDGATKTSQQIDCSSQVAATSVGSVVTAVFTTTNSIRHNLFCRLADGDSGVRRINSVRFTSGNSGLMALVLVKPLVTLTPRENNTQTELEMVTQGIPPIRVYDGAYLNMFIGATTQLVNQPSVGTLNFIWDEGT